MAVRQDDLRRQALRPTGPPPSPQQRASRTLDVRPDFRHAHRAKTWMAGTSPTHTNSDVSLRLVYGGGFAARRLELHQFAAAAG